MANKIFTLDKGHGVIGATIRLNLMQCMVLAEFGAELARVKETGQFTYPDQIDDFFKGFDSFRTLSDENLFKEQDPQTETKTLAEEHKW